MRSSLHKLRVVLLIHVRNKWTIMKSVSVIMVFHHR